MTKKPLGAPGLELPEEGWTNDPSPGLYWVRYVNQDGSKTQPAFCIVLPTGPFPKYAAWAQTPNLGVAPAFDHESQLNYFVEPNYRTEYLPYFEEHQMGEDGKPYTARFDIVARKL